MTKYSLDAYRKLSGTCGWSPQFLGHAQLDTTQIYAASTMAMIKDS
jgi:hypothetical protein